MLTKYVYLLFSPFLRTLKRDTLSLIANSYFSPSMMNVLSDYMNVNDAPLNVNNVTSFDVDMRMMGKMNAQDCLSHMQLFLVKCGGKEAAM